MHKLLRLFRARICKPFCRLTGGLLALALMTPVALPKDKELTSEEGQFDIYVSGKKIGEEKFSIQYSGDSIRSSSAMNFRDPGNKHQKVRMDTILNMDTQYLPKSYQVQTDIEGRKLEMKGTFVPGQANFEYEVDGVRRKMGLLVGGHYVILDTNVFHHFIFVARSFDLGANKTQSIDVVIPQELDSGTLKVTAEGLEEISVRGKKMTLNHLKVDSGRLLIDLWVDSGQTLCKIALPAKGIEVIRNP